MYHQFVLQKEIGSVATSEYKGVGSSRVLEHPHNSVVRQQVSDSDTPLPDVKWIDSKATIAIPYREEAVWECKQSAKKPTCVRLNLEDLKCFEVLVDQFQHWGMTFNNAIALQPSNDAYIPRSGSKILMGAPKNGWMEITFKRPVRFFNCHVTSSQRTILTAHDHDETILTRAEIPGPNLAGSDSAIPPNAQMCVSAPNIYRVTFYAFDGQLSVNDLSFGLTTPEALPKS